jgi:EF hand
MIIRVVVASMVASVASAAEEPSRAYERPLTKEESRFRALDQNNDRQLSEEEFRVDATTTTEFAALDGNHDGFLSMSEFISRPIPPAKTSTKPSDSKR